MLFSATVLALISHALATSGKGTYYYNDANEGACGGWTSQSDHVVAISTSYFNQAQDASPHCGKEVEICSGGKCLNAKVVDACVSCSENDLDLSPGTIEYFDSNYQNDGVIDIQWWFV